MATTLKTFFSPELVRRLAADLQAAHADFPVAAFVRDATRGLNSLELLDRGRHIAKALATHLPPAYPAALDVLVRSLGPEHASDELLGVGMAPFYYLPHTLFVAVHGLDCFDISMQAQYELTKRFSAEASIRPYIAHDPERAWRFFERWTTDHNPHVRRLVSEGTRLRLPWAPRVAWLDEHPEHVVDLLERLKDDSSTMVRRSVANNLNDLAKVRPDLLTQTAEAWLHDATAERRALVEHALRYAVKRGDPAALRALGFGAAPRVAIDAVSITPSRVRIGGRVVVTFTVTSTSTRAQSLLVDLVVHFVKARGISNPKVFKVGRVSLAPRASVRLRTSVSLAVHTTRVPRTGRHEVDVVINGRATRIGAFDVVSERRTKRGA